MSVRKRMLLANGEEHVITLQPAMEMYGAADTDATTPAEPMRDFELQQGNTRVETTILLDIRG